MNQRNMLRTLVGLSVVLILLCSGGVASAAKGAGGGGGGAGRGGQQLDKIKELLSSLNLTPDQSKQVDQILDETREQIAGMAKDLKGASPEERRQKVQPIIKDMMEKIRGVLTEDQQKQLREKMQERRQQRGENGGNAGPGKKAPNGDVTPSATQPSATNDTIGIPAPRGPMLQRVADKLAALDLSPEQKMKTDAILDDTAKQIAALRSDAQANPDATREKAKAVFQSTRSQIAAVLTPEQQQKMMAARESSPPVPAAAPAPTDAGKTATPAASTPNVTAAKAAAAFSTTQPAAAAQIRSLFPGVDAPPFRLNRLSGSSVTLDSFVNKPLVLIFGSYSCPTFRDKIAEIDKLSRRYQRRAAFLIVYTREAYPANEWEVQRNLTEQIKVEQHKSLADRQHMAQLARESLKITTDIAVDDIDDGVTDAYDAMPNGAYVVLNGKIIARQKWADPLAMPFFIDAAMKKSKAS